MTKVLIAVALGVLVGHFNIMSVNPKKISKLTSLCLFIMLLAMGAQLGANDKLLGDLGRLGWQALVLAFASIVGSVLLVRLAENHISKQLEQSKQKAKRAIGH
ncbi:LysO family transporter [Desulforamulus aeronauticus]|uniref:Lysine exporter LysO n=1 Tax=Desulforamulus aeronauticus DSM 10349 TaxID=1121421 RepID=A0A1M6R790_9FIRM|nr:LysO family transporter [Desulforamulus aeronauticus]SHK28361.1 Membrane protein of unknown function [Desulforamulus aeronauticus DSM 10349]